MKYPKLFSKGYIGKLELRNRIVLPPMGTNIASHTGEATDDIVRYYEERAKGGCGLIITEITRVDEGTGVGMNGQLSVSSAKYIPKLVKMVDAVHRHDSKIFLQLHHPGREAGRAMLGGLQPVAPSPIADKVVQEVPRELTTEECEVLVKKFVTGARFAQMAGFDGVEFHAAHGYLINQFLSPYSNKRTDKFGGDFTGRLQFLADIVTGVTHVCGPDFPISVRLSCDEFVEGGLKLPDSVKIAQELEKLGVAAINVSAGIYESGYAIIEPQGLPEGWKKHLATEIKKNVNIPVIAVNNIKYPETAENYLTENVCDFVALGRAQLSDPEWGNKAKAGRVDEIRKCLGCMYCFQSLGMLHPVECTVNPVLSRELYYNEDTLKKDGAGRLVVVVGGGPGGMQAALVLAKRGYKVTLFEQGESLGGDMILASIPPHKQMISELIKTQTLELKQAGVEVVLNKKATPEDIKALNPYGVMVAIGANPIVPPIAGIDLPHVYTATEVLRGDVKLKGKNVSIIGGGVTGLETAEVLAKENKVTVVEMTKDLGAALYVSVRMFLLGRLNAAGVKLLTQQKLVEVKDGSISLLSTDTAETKEIETDAVVLALGVKADKAAVDEFVNAFDHVTYLGDAHKPGLIANAMKEANDKAYVF